VVDTPYAFSRRHLPLLLDPDELMSLWSHREGLSIRAFLRRVALPSSNPLPLLCYGRNPRAIAVDFQKINSTKKPAQDQSLFPSPRTPVAAMIALKESFMSYRQFIEHAVKTTQTLIDPAQRKTHGENNQLLNRGAADLAFIRSRPYAR
jgi:hypothetical protein